MEEMLASALSASQFNVRRLKMMQVRRDRGY